MKNITKRITAVLMSLLVCVAVLPAFAFAAEEEPVIVTKVIDGVSEYGLEMSHYEDSEGNIYEMPGTRLVGDVTGSRTRKANSLPSSYNSVTEGNVTVAKSQGSMGNCWAFASIGCMEAYAVTHMNSPLNNTDYSEAHLTWYANSKSQDTNDLMYLDGIDKQDPYNAGGNPEMAALCFARGSGVTLESDYPFNGNNTGLMGNYNDATARYEHNIGLLDSSYQLTSPSEVKQTIIDNGGVAVSYCHGDEYLNHDGPYTYKDGTPAPYYCTFAAYYCDTAYDANHAVMIVGWDDNYSRNNFRSDCRPSSDGAWICKNSWGDNFGVNGLFWISYEDKSLEDFQTFSMTADYDYVSAYSGYCNPTYYTLSSSTKMGNIFVAEGERTLEAAGFYLKYDNVPATIKVYKGIPANPSGPVSGNPVATASGTFRQGYNTVKFSSPVSLSTGERYSIVVEMAAVNGKSVFTVEGSNANCVNGTSYVYYGNSWKNCYSNNFGNVFVYAYTNDIVQTVSAQSVSIDQNSQSVYAGQYLQLSATVLPAETSNPDVLWSSSDTSVAAVSPTGLVTALNTGTAVITACTTDGSNLSDSITITVLDNHFTITYLVDGLTYQVQTYEIGDNIVPPAAPHKTGYTFLYWNPSYPETMPPQNLTVSAVFQVQQFLLRTYEDSVLTSSQYYNYNTVINEPSHQSKTGYVFNGWKNSSGAFVSFPFPLTADTDLTASYSPASDTAYRFEVYRMGTDGVYPDTPESVEYYTGTTDERVTVSYTVTEGFTLDRISTMSGIVAGDGSLVLKAYLHRRTYTVTTVTDSGNQVYTYYYGQTVEPLTATAPEGYRFYGWQPQIPATMPAQDLVVTPLFIKHAGVPSIKIVSTNELNLNAGESAAVYVAVTGDGYVAWSVQGGAFEISPSQDGRYCVITAVRNGRAVIGAKLVSSSGEVLCSDSVTAYCRNGASYLFNRLLQKNEGQKFRLFISIIDFIKAVLFELR